MIAVAAIIHVMVSLPLPRPVKYLDFAHYYTASRLLTEGANPYRTTLPPVYDRLGFEFHPYETVLPSTPAFMWMFSPLALLSPAKAFILLTIINAASLIAILLLARKLLSDRLSTCGIWFMWAGAIASATVYWNFCTGHVELVLTALILFAYFCRTKGSYTIACLFVALAGLIKLFPLVLLPWFIWRGSGAWRGLIKRLIATSCFSAAAIAATGIGFWTDFFKLAMPTVQEHSIGPGAFNLSIPALAGMINYAAHDCVLGPHQILIWQVGSAFGAMLILLAYWACLRGSADTEAEFCLLSSVMLAAGTLTWGYYLVFLIFPVAVAAARVRPFSLGMAAVLLLYVLLNHLPKSIDLGAYKYFRIACHYAAVYGMVGLALFFLRELRPCQDNHRVRRKP